MSPTYTQRGSGQTQPVNHHNSGIGLAAVRTHACGRKKRHALATVRLASSGSLRGSERRLSSEGGSRDRSRGFLSPRGKRCGGLRRVAPPLKAVVTQ